MSALNEFMNPKGWVGNLIMVILWAIAAAIHFHAGNIKWFGFACWALGFRMMKLHNAIPSPQPPPR